MEEQIISISKLFGNRSTSKPKCKENLQLFECEVEFMLTKRPSADDFHRMLPTIARRDNWRLRLLTDAGEDLFDVRRGANINVDYIESKLDPYIDSEVRLVYNIDKSKEDGMLTIYEYSIFLDYMQSLCVADFISLYQKNLDDKLILEIWSSDAEDFSSSSIAVVRRGGSVLQLSRDDKKIPRIDEHKAYCQWNHQLSDLLPEDLRIIRGNKSGRLAQIFDQMCLLLSALYVADFSSVDKSGIKIKMAGFRMVDTIISSAKISDISFDLQSVEQWYNIYDWCYTGGYTTDRLSIARNLISLNCLDVNKLTLNSSTFDAIKSNFKIFEKENVRQYIKVRNEVSKTLLDLQDKVNSTVETFTGNFRKNVVGLGTFFLTLVVVRVVSHGDWFGGFTTQIVALSFIFVILSAVVLYYSRRTLEIQEKLYMKHYELLRSRYNALLSKQELDELFEDGDPNKVGTHSNYIQWQKDVYTWIWGGALFVFSIFLILVWCYNIFASTNIVRIIKSIIACCIQNI